MFQQEEKWKIVLCRGCVSDVYVYIFVSLCKREKTHQQVSDNKLCWSKKNSQAHVASHMPIKKKKKEETPTNKNIQYVF